MPSRRRDSRHGPAESLKFPLHPALTRLDFAQAPGFDEIRCSPSGVAVLGAVPAAGAL